MIEPVDLQQQINYSILVFAEAENRFQRCQALQQLSSHIEAWLNYRNSPRISSYVFENDFQLNLKNLSQYLASMLLQLSDPLVNFAEHCRLKAQLVQAYDGNTVPNLEIKALLHLWHSAYCIEGSWETDGTKVKAVNSDFVNWTRHLLPCSGKRALNLIYMLLEILKYCDRQEIVIGVLESLATLPQGVEASRVYPGIVSRIVGCLSQFSSVSFSAAIDLLSQLLLQCKDDEQLATKSIEWVDFIFNKYGSRPNRNLLPLLRAAIEVEAICKNLEGIFSQYILTREASEIAPLLKQAKFTHLKVAIKALVTREMQNPNDASLQLFRGYLRLKDSMQNAEVDFYLALVFFLKFDILVKDDDDACLDDVGLWTKMDTSHIDLEYNVDLDPEIKGVVRGKKRWLIKPRKTETAITSTLPMTIASVTKNSINHKRQAITSDDLNICTTLDPDKLSQQPLETLQPLIQVVAESDNVKNKGVEDSLTPKGETRLYKDVNDYKGLFEILKGDRLPANFALGANIHHEQYNSTMSLYIEVARDYFKHLDESRQIDILSNVVSCIEIESTESKAMASASKLLHLTSIFTSAIDDLTKFKNVLTNLLDHLTSKKVLHTLAFSYGFNTPLVKLCKARLCTCASQILYMGCLQGLNLLSRPQIGSLLYFILPECSLGSKMTAASAIELVKVLTLVHVTFSPVAKPMLQVYYNYLVNAAISTLSDVKLVYGPTRVCQVLAFLLRCNFADTKSIFDLVVAISNNHYTKITDAYNCTITSYDIGVMLYTFNMLLVALVNCESWAPESKFEDEVIDSNLAICSLISTKSRYFVDSTRNGYFALVAIYRCFEAFAAKPRVASVRMAEVWPCLEFFLKNNTLQSSRHMIVAARILNLGLDSSFHVIDFRLNQIMPRLIQLVQDSNISAAHQCNVSSSFKATISLLLLVKRISETTTNSETLGQCLAVALCACKFESLIKWAILILEPLFSKDPVLISQVLSIYQKQEFSSGDLALLDFATKTPGLCRSTIKFHTPTLS